MNPIIFEIAGKQFAIEEIDYKTSERRTFYRILNDALRQNALRLIRICLNCEKFFLREGRRSTYCSGRCETVFNNKRRTESGYFAQKMAERRAELAKKKRQTKNTTASYTPEAYLKKLVNAAESDSTGKLAAIYKNLGGGRPLDGRRVLSKLKNRPWKEIEADTRKKIVQLSKE
jgi:hypothetical protein